MYGLRLSADCRYVLDVYCYLLCTSSASGRIIGAKDHASIQINVAEVSVNIRPLNSHGAAVRLTVSAVISRWRPHFSRSTVREHERLTYFNTTGGLIDSQDTKTSSFGV